MGVKLVRIMGLDMYLVQKHWISGEIRKKLGKIDVKKLDLPFEFDKVEEVTEEVATWRKANAIHKWFVDNVQDGEDDTSKTSLVRIEQIEELLDLVNEVLKWQDRAEELLPVQVGFFFGGTEYDDWYFDNLKYTKGVFEKILADGKSGDLYYSSSW